MSSLSQPTERKQARTEGNGVPQWLVELGIGPGEFFLDAKPRARGAMKCSGWTGEMGRVYSCLSLHCMAFASQVAVRLERGKLTPIGPKDISHETGLERRQVRRALAALEDGGFLERVGERITCYAVPHSAGTVATETSKAQNIEFPGDLPDYLLHYLRRFRPRQMPDAAALEELKPLCSSAVEIEGKIRHILKPETEGRKLGASGHRRSKGRTRVSAQSDAKIITNSNGISKLEGLEGGVQIERKERKKNSSSSSPVNGNGKPMMMTAEMEQVSEAIRKFCLPERGALDLMVRNCHAKLANVTPAMICAAVEMKGPLAVKKDNPIGFLVVAVPNVLTGVGSQEPILCPCGGIVENRYCSSCHRQRG